MNINIQQLISTITEMCLTVVGLLEVMGFNMTTDLTLWLDVNINML